MCEEQEIGKTWKGGAGRWWERRTASIFEPSRELLPRCHQGMPTLTLGVVESQVSLPQHLVAKAFYDAPEWRARELTESHT